ncbi:MAG: DUF3737 family protein [Clostridia bacterium]|nr:DUF3737 family protein [Clostridia bacterium]
MEIIENKRFDEERALYGREEITVKKCRFDGPRDGESAFKESARVSAEGCYFNLRYPFWHCENVRIVDSEMTGLCRAALWYTRDATLERTLMHGIKALRECDGVKISECDIRSPEFGWRSRNIDVIDTAAAGEYFMFEARGIKLKNLALDGKYSFQYVEGGIIEDSVLNTKDAFWHAKDVTVRDSVINGEYLGWYSENLTLERCIIKGTQPFCYCRGLKLVDCRMEGCDLSFEKSEVEAAVLSEIDSVKNPKHGRICAKGYKEIILDVKTECELLTF